MKNMFLLHSILFILFLNCHEVEADCRKPSPLPNVVITYPPGQEKNKNFKEKTELFFYCDFGFESIDTINRGDYSVLCLGNRWQVLLDNPKKIVRPFRCQKRPATTPATTPAPSGDTSFDAVSMIRGELFMFKGKYFWRLNDRGIPKDYPAEIKRFWYNLPEDFKRVDAVYERPHDEKIVIFIGNQYWLFTANILDPGYPQPLTKLGLPADLNKIDEAFVWGASEKTFFVSGHQHWLFDERKETIEFDST